MQPSSVGSPQIQKVTDLKKTTRSTIINIYSTSAPPLSSSSTHISPSTTESEIFCSYYSQLSPSLLPSFFFFLSLCLDNTNAGSPIGHSVLHARAAPTYPPRSLISNQISPKVSEKACPIFLTSFIPGNDPSQSVNCWNRFWVSQAATRYNLMLHIPDACKIGIRKGLSWRVVSIGTRGPPARPRIRLEGYYMTEKCSRKRRATKAPSSILPSCYPQNHIEIAIGDKAPKGWRLHLKIQSNLARNARAWRP